ncbi:ATP-grasp domain-containing protein [Halorubrum vacuolatum]|uniref:Ribosomal protein S6--L-glutamate ligase n=1 Tax=Halorubrum vacuolatum TaxID=63740 RepID=A0A238VVS1_HALVU|nr:RimK family alpha-L-glutamate ligase [Halorubrum vacuolatum]SNR38442.1 ribosomal protein S6--L-glutamate ligase [Halorubrum vacuolatum]
MSDADRLRLAVTTDAETLERIRDPLATRGIDARHLPVKGRSIPVSGGIPTDIASAFDVGFVYPSRLMEGGALDARLEIPWVNGRDAVVTSRNKGGVVAALDAADVPVPRTTMISNPVDEAVVTEAVERFSFPVVVKPNSTTRGIGVAKATDLDSLHGIIDYLNLVHDYRATGDKSYLLQEYLPNATDYRVMVIDGTYAGAVERRLPPDALAAGRWKHNVHRGAVARGVDLGPEARALAERTARTLDIDWLGVDLLAVGDRAAARSDGHEADDGRLLVNETNARPTVDAATKYEPDFYDRLAALVRRIAAGD